MRRLWTLLGCPSSAALLLCAFFVLGPERGNATTVAFTPDSPADGTTSLNTLITIPADPSNANGGTLTFTLTLGADYTSPTDSSPGANGFFSMTLDANNNLGWSFAILTAGPSTAGSTNYGDFTGPAGFLGPGNITDTSIWTVGILAGNFPVNLTITSVFNGSCLDANDCFTPNSTFSYDFTPNSVSATPLPAALPLFASGMGLMGWMGWRRRRKFQAIEA